MAQVVALDGLLAQRRVWKGQARSVASPPQPTGWSELDAALPTAGWPEAALSELLLPGDGMGELQLLWPTLARLSQRKDALIALVCPPYRPCPAAWHAAGIALSAVQLVTAATAREALWATEQCLRSGACSAVLSWPRNADDRALRRLQVAAETGQALGFAFRPMKAAANPSPASLRLLFEAPGQLRVLKCRGGLAPTRPILIAGLQVSVVEQRREPVPVAPMQELPVPPRPGLHEVLHGGPRPIAVPMPSPVSAPPRTGPQGPRSLAPVLRSGSPAAPVLPPATPGTASPAPHGIAATPVQA